MQSFLVTHAYGEKIARTLFCQKCISYVVSSVCGSETYIFDNVIIIIFYELVNDITWGKANIKMIIDLWYILFVVMTCYIQKLIPLVIEHFPAGTSSKLTMHFSQLVLKGILNN